jgi:hypothetical protein
VDQCDTAIVGFNVDETRPDDVEYHVPAADLGLEIDDLVESSTVLSTQTVRGPLERLPSPGYHLWAIRDWERLHSVREFYPEMELKIHSRTTGWADGEAGAQEHTWSAPNFFFGGEPGDLRNFEIIMVNEVDHQKLKRSKQAAVTFSELRDKAKEGFKGYPTPTMRWEDIRSERCQRIIVEVRSTFGWK